MVSIAHPLRSAPFARFIGLRSFTLLELLAVMGMLLALTTLTAVSVGTLARDANRTAATNTVVAMLGTARGVAIRDNAYVALTFRVSRDRRTREIPSNPQVVELVVAKWTGEVVTDVNADRDVFADRFVPVPGIASKQLPPGILVAGPAFGNVTDQSVGANDRFWITQPRFEGKVEPEDPTGRPGFTPDLDRTELGWGIAVLFGPDGRVLSRNPEAVLEVSTIADGSPAQNNAFVKGFLDADGDEGPRKGLTAVAPYPPDANVQWFVYDEPMDEPAFDYVPYLAVFSDIEAKEVFPLASGPPGAAGSWRGASITNASTGGRRRRDDISRFIEQQSDRIVFNRYSGVASLEKR